MNSASLCSLAGRLDNPLPTQFLAPIDSLKIPALATFACGIDSLESIPGLHKRLKIRALVVLLITGSGKRRHGPVFFPCSIIAGPAF